jgi:hypothetical protein
MVVAAGSPIFDGWILHIWGNNRHLMSPQFAFYEHSVPVFSRAPSETTRRLMGNQQFNPGTLPNSGSQRRDQLGMDGSGCNKGNILLCLFLFLFLDKQKWLIGRLNKHFTKRNTSAKVVDSIRRCCSDGGA